LTGGGPIVYLDSVSETDVERLAALVGLPISPTDLPGVAVAFETLMAVAQLVRDFPLPDDVEAAPVFHP
jgi:1-carboxybiuret hydrolase subunit AtzG-like protein